MKSRNFRKVLIRAVTLIAVLSMIFTAVSCDKNNEKPDRYGEGTSDVEIDHFEYGFIEEDNYKDRETTIAETKRSLDIKVDTVYYCMMEFNVSARNLNDGTSLMNVLVKFDNLGVANGTTEEAGTGNATEMIFTDAGTGTDSKISTLAYKIPPDPDKPKTIRILVRLVPVTVGESHISVSFEPAEYGEFKILGEDGFTKNLEVKRVQIEAPVITVDRANLKVKWNHVKHADFYVVYFENKSIEFVDVDPQYTPVGTELSFDLSQFIDLGVTYGTVKVQACTKSDNFLKSSHSNAETDVNIL